MNRRQFFTRMVGAVAAAGLWTVKEPLKTGITFKGVPMVFDDMRPKTNTMTFINPRWPKWKSDAV